MRKAAIYSIILHLAVLILILLDLNFASFKKIDTSRGMVVDFVAIAEKSAAPKKALAPTPTESAKEEAKEKEEAKKAEKPEVIEKPKEPDESKADAKEPVKEPEKPEVERQPEKPKAEVPLKKPKEKPKKEKKKEAPKKPKKKNEKKAEVDLAKPKPKGTNAKAVKNESKAKKKSLDDVLSGVTKDKETDAIDDMLDSDDGENAEDLAPVVTASEIDAVRHKIRPCWSVPAGAKGAKDLAVDIDMELTADGTVVKAEIVDRERANSDPYYRIAAESAQRAVLDPKCNPLPFPKGKHDQWKNVTMTFNPKDMF